MDVIQQLLEAGADINAAITNGLYGEREGMTVLHLVSLWAEAHALIDVFLSAKANVNAVDRQGRTPLHIAAENNQTEVAKQLIAAGADVSVVDETGKTPLHIAVAGGRSGSGTAELAAVLLAAGANPLLTTQCQRTAFDCGAERDNEQMMQLLLQSVQAPAANVRAAATVAVENGCYKTLGASMCALRLKDPEAAESVVESLPNEMWKLGWAAAKSEEELHLQQQRAASAAQQQELQQLRASGQQLMADLAAVHRCGRRCVFHLR